MMKNEQIYSCGYCGKPCYKDGEALPEIPKDYNPDNYEHIVCEECRNELEYKEHYIEVTHEMAMDAQDLSLERQIIRW